MTGKRWNASFGLGESLPQVKEFKFCGILFMSDGRTNWEMDLQVGILPSILMLLLSLFLVNKKKKCQLKGKALGLLVCLHSSPQLWSSGLNNG